MSHQHPHGCCRKGKVEEAEKATADQRTKLEEMTKDLGVAKLEVGMLKM